MTNLGFGCLALFLLPFAAAGVFAAVQGVRSATSGDWAQAGLLAVFALTFGGVGFGGLAATRVGRRRAGEAAALKARNPAAPWLWRPDWAAGWVDDSSRGTMWFAWIFATLWNLISLPGVVLAVRAAVWKQKPAALLILLFPAIGIALLVWAIRATLRYRRFGVSRLELDTRPGVVGHSLAGTVRTTVPLRPVEGFEVVLRCIRRVTSGSSKNRSTTESVLWQEERRVAGEVARDASGMGTRIPVGFALPPDARACDDSVSDDQILWRLEVTAGVPGIDYASSFEVPVFRTELSKEPPTVSEAALGAPVALDTYRQPPGSRIEVSTTRRGTEIFFPAARNPGVASGLTLFAALWGGVVWALMHSRAPLVFPIVFGGFGVLLLVGVLELWLRESRVVAGNGSLTLASGYLVTGGGQTLPASAVDDVTTRITMQSGTRPYYDIVVLTKAGKKLTAGRAVRDKREAEWLAGTVKQALGVK
ncbi:MAG TPA: hypothetical protein VHR41_04415 [Gemmatimonadales bacterium]|nr:hypothetical protein [Gemmatimonadales bacterium]